MGNHNPSISNSKERIPFYRSRFLYRLLFFGSVIGIIVGSLLPSTQLPDPSINDKIIHFAAYLFAGFLALKGFPKHPFRAICFASLLLIGCGIEFVQQYVPGRSFDLVDMVANACGVAIALLAARFFST